VQARLLRKRPPDLRVKILAMKNWERSFKKLEAGGGGGVLPRLIQADLGTYRLCIKFFIGLSSS